MTSKIEFHDKFVPEFENFQEAVQDEIYAKARLLETYGPTLGRPHCDTLKSSRLKNLKELRFQSGDQVWRVAFAFDRQRKAILLCAGSKSGVSEDRFYKTLIRIAEDRLKDHADK